MKTSSKAAESVLQNASVLECLVTFSAGKLLFFVFFSNLLLQMHYHIWCKQVLNKFTVLHHSEWTLAFINNTGISEQHDIALILLTS